MDEVLKFGEVTVEEVMAATGVDRETADRQIAELMFAAERASDLAKLPDLPHRTWTITPSTHIPSFARPLFFAAIARNPEGVSLTLKNSASGELVSKSVALSKTVSELLMFDSPNLFPNVITPQYRVGDFVVTLVRTNRVLVHTKTLRDSGVIENDTLKIFSPTVAHLLDPPSATLRHSPPE